jgi:hypothetical protein
MLITNLLNNFFDFKSMDRLQTRRVVRARSRPDEDTPDEDEAPVPGPSGRARLR